jgi:hypothetical protein
LFIEHSNKRVLSSFNPGGIIAMTKKNLVSSHPTESAETRREVLKLSLAVAAFGAAMGIAGPSAAAVEERAKHKNNASRSSTKAKHKTNQKNRPQVRIKESGT